MSEDMRWWQAEESARSGSNPTPYISFWLAPFITSVSSKPGVCHAAGAQGCGGLLCASLSLPTPVERPGKISGVSEIPFLQAFSAALRSARPRAAPAARPPPPAARACSSPALHPAPPQTAARPGDVPLAARRPPFAPRPPGRRAQGPSRPSAAAPAQPWGSRPSTGGCLKSTPRSS
jgi:hypothetical protein